MTAQSQQKLQSNQKAFIKTETIFIFDSDLVWRMQLMIIKG